MVFEFTEQYVPNGNRTLIIYIDYGYRLFVHFLPLKTIIFAKNAQILKININSS